MRWDQIASHYHAMPRKPGSRTHPLLLLSVAEFAGHVHSWAIERVEHGKLTEWEQEMVDLLPWQDSTSESAENLESDSFFANYNNQD